MYKKLLIMFIAVGVLGLAGCGSSLGDQELVTDLETTISGLNQDINKLTERNNELTELLREKDNIVVPVVACVESTGEVVEYAEEIIEEVVEVKKEKVSYIKIDTNNSFILNANNSRNVFRKLTGVDFMNGLNATKVKAPEDATKALLTVTLGRDGKASLQNAMYTWNITVGYESCKIDEVLDRDNFPHTRTVDLANVDCQNRGVKNFLPLLKDGVRVAIYNAQLDGTSYDGVIKFD